MAAPGAIRRLGRALTRRPRNGLDRLLPPILLAGLIFFLSAQPDLNSGLGVWDFFGRKLVHMTEYALLWLLVLRATDWRRPWLAFVITLAYSGTDEFHQTFVHGRHGTPVDMAIDMCGVAVAAVLLRLRGRRPQPAR